MLTRIERAVFSIVSVVAVAAVLALVALALPPRIEAQQTDTVPEGTAFAFEAITVSTTAIGFTAATISPTNAPGAKSAFCSVEAQPIRYRLSGTPSAGSGHPKLAATDLTVVGINNMLTFRAIRSGGTDATLSCTYFR